MVRVNFPNIEIAWSQKDWTMLRYLFKHYNKYYEDMIRLAFKYPLKYFIGGHGQPELSFSAFYAHHKLLVQTLQTDERVEEWSKVDVAAVGKRIQEGIERMKTHGKRRTGYSQTTRPRMDRHRSDRLLPGGRDR
jgi:hypothetical protein